jgi:HEAT repeat protein
VTETGLSTELELQSALVELHKLGYRVRSISELRDSGLDYRDAVEVLLESLASVSTDGAKEQLVRALSFRWAKPQATAPLLAAFAGVSADQDPSGLGLRWTIGNAIYSIDDRKAEVETIRLALDPRYGRSREMIVLELGRVGSAAAIDALLLLALDPDVSGHAVSALSRLHVERARSIFLDKSNDSRAWVRAAARRGVSRLDT